MSNSSRIPAARSMLWGASYVLKSEELQKAGKIRSDMLVINPRFLKESIETAVAAALDEAATIARSHGAPMTANEIVGLRDAWLKNSRAINNRMTSLGEPLGDGAEAARAAEGPDADDSLIIKAPEF